MMNDLKDLQALHELLIADDPQVGVPFDQSWMWGFLSESHLTCDTGGCTARAVVIVRVGNGAGVYCEACWRRDGLVQFLEELATLKP